MLTVVIQIIIPTHPQPLYRSSCTHPQPLYRSFLLIHSYCTDHPVLIRSRYAHHPAHFHYRYADHPHLSLPYTDHTRHVQLSPLIRLWSSCSITLQQSVWLPPLILFACNKFTVTGRVLMKWDIDDFGWDVLTFSIFWGVQMDKKLIQLKP